MPPRAASRILRDARLQAGLSQRDLARRAKAAQSAVARIEGGLTQPSMQTLERLVRAAGFELVAFLEQLPVLDRQLLDDVPRILALSPENRLREIANINRFVTAAKRG